MSLDTNSHLTDAFRQREQAQRQLVIFTSESFVAHEHLRDLLPFLKEQGIKPVIFITASCKSPRAHIESLEKYSYYEAEIFSEVIYPALDTRPGAKRLTDTFNDLVRTYGARTQKVENLKDPAIQQALEAPGTIGAISIYQDAIFKKDFIAKVKEKGFFWNLHPALLPEHRGLYVVFWSMLRGETRHGYTLHEIDEGIDTGKILRTYEGRLDLSKSVLESYFDFARAGTKLVTEALGEYLRSGKVEVKAAAEAPPSEYFTFPTENDVSEAWDKGVRLWPSKQEMLSIYRKLFGDDAVLSVRIANALNRMEHGHMTLPMSPGRLPQQLAYSPSKD